MAALPSIGNALRKAEMEYHEKFGHTIVSIHHIFLMNRIGICYTACHLENQIVSPTTTGFQGINCCVQYLASNPNKTIFYLSNYYDGSNFIRLTWSGNQVED